MIASCTLETMAGRIGTQVNLDHSAFSYRGPRQVSGRVFYDYQNKNGEIFTGFAGLGYKYWQMCVLHLLDSLPTQNPAFLQPTNSPSSSFASIQFGKFGSYDSFTSHPRTPNPKREHPQPNIRLPRKTSNLVFNNPNTLRNARGVSR